MIGGNPNDFLDRIYSCQDTIYIYMGVKYWFQGYMPDPETVQHGSRTVPAVERERNMEPQRHHHRTLSAGFHKSTSF